MAASTASRTSVRTISVHGVCPRCDPSVWPLPPGAECTGFANALLPAMLWKSERLSARGATGTIRNGTPWLRNVLNVSATRGTSSGAVSRSLTSRISPFGCPALASTEWASVRPDEICVPPEKMKASDPWKFEPAPHRSAGQVEDLHGMTVRVVTAPRVPMDREGAAVTSRTVYGLWGDESTERTAPSSQIRPFSSTSTRSATLATTPRSWLMKSSATWSSRRSSANRSSTAA